MSRIRSTSILILIFACGLGFLSACNGRPHEDWRKARIDADDAGQTAIKEFDKNANGTIEGPELDAVPSLKSSMQRIDKNHDDAISASEITACINEWQAYRYAIGNLTCIVTHNNEPLKDAEVKFVSEAFLGEWKPPTARGRTDSKGTALMDIEIPDVPTQVLCGFYRVEITKKGEDIPEKYNSKTVLGMGVFWNDPDFSNEVRFNLEY